MSKKLVVLLGVSGTLSADVIRNIAEGDHALDDIHMIGFDLQKQPDAAINLLWLDGYYRCDLRSRRSVTAALNRIPFAQYDDVRLLICAAKMNPPTFNDDLELDVDTLYERLQINLVGQVHFATAFAMRCVKAGCKGRVVAVGSTAAHVGSSDVGYAASKAGLEGMVRSLSKYLGQKGITAFVVHTGIFESAMEREVSDARKQVTIGMTHLKRKGELSEITNFVSYYLLKAPDFATGQIVDINGGQHT